MAGAAARRRGCIRPSIPTGPGLLDFRQRAHSSSSQDGSTRGGQNLFANSIVALDLRTGAYRWHFQSIHHDIWDMDNVMAPVLADVRIRGRMRKLVVYGSKSGMYFILDRRDGSPRWASTSVPVPQEPRQKTWPTQPFPRQGGWTEHQVVDQPLGTGVPGDPNRAVPNYVQGCLYAAHWDVPILSIPGHGGGADWNHQSFSHSTGLVYTGFGYVAAAHSLTEASNGLRPPGEYQTGGIVAVDPAPTGCAWKKRMPYSLAHGNGILTTAGDLLFIGQPDGNLLALDARNGRRAVAVPDRRRDQHQPDQVRDRRRAVPRGVRRRHRHPVRQLGAARRLPVGVQDRRHACAPRRTPPPPVVRRPVSGGPVEGSVVNNTVVLARTYNAATGHRRHDRVDRGQRMAPTHLRVPVGTTVTFINPADNVNVHGATQFFEGLFDVRLAPGESFEYTFTTAGRVLLQRLLQPATHRKDRGLSDKEVTTAWPTSDADSSSRRAAVAAAAPRGPGPAARPPTPTSPVDHDDRGRDDRGRAAKTPVYDPAFNVVPRHRLRRCYHAWVARRPRRNRGR